ncbi:MAG: hypothetical protein JWO05_2348 [Gemmatimonadetes bacterium]|nr:hypothetical protein [Gemmatimonadota bacterium]
MKVSRLFVASALVVVASSAAHAQSSQCPSGAPLSNAQVSQDACQQAVDLYQYMSAQLGTAIAGGNATLGQGGTMGGLGHFSIGVRVNAVAGTLPQVDKFTQSPNGAQKQTLPTEDNKPVPMPTVDAAFGIFKGIPLGLTNVGGIDLLVNAAYAQDISGNNVALTVNGSKYKFGFGARLGLLQESLLVPGVSVTYLKRDLPEINIIGTSGNDELTVRNLNIKTTAWRLVASKSLVIFGLAVGVGKDKYDQSALVHAKFSQGLQTATSSDVSLTQVLDRTNVFADLSLNLPIFKLVGEIGQVSGGSVPTYNSFANKAADASRVYGSVGLRLSW